MTLNTYNNQSPDLQMQAGAFWIIYVCTRGQILF